MRILLVHHNTQNTGDEAIVESTIFHLRKTFPGVDIVLESGNPEHSNEKFKDVKIVERLFSVKNMRLTQKIYSFDFLIKNIPFLIRTTIALFASWFFLFFKLDKFMFPILSEYKKADLILSVAGDSISMDYAWYFRFYEIWLVKKLNKPIILFAQSVGPFSGISLKYARKHLSMVDAILARDKKTIELMKQYNVKTDVQLTADIAIILESMSNKVVRDIIEKYNLNNIIGIVIRTSKGNPYNMNEYNRYIDGMINVVKELKETKEKVIFIASIPDDALAADEINKKYNLNLQILKLYEYMPSEVKSILETFKLVISPRMHPIILASTMGVPVIGLGKEFKMQEYLSIIGLGDFFIKMLPLDDRLVMEKIKFILKNRDKVKYSITTHLDEAIKLSNKNIEFIQDMFSNGNK